MKIGLLSAILPDQTFEEVIDIAHDNGYTAVELACWPKGKGQRRYAGVTHIDVDKINKETKDYYLNYAASKNIEIMALGYYPNPLSDDESKNAVTINHIKKVINAASILGVPRISTFIGKNQYKSDEENFENFKKVWPGIIGYAEVKDILVGIENCPMYFTKDEWPGGQNLASSPHNWKKMFELIPSKNFGLSYDPSHLHLQGMDYITPLHDFKDRIFHIHLKDIKVYQNKLNEYGIFTYPLNYMAPKIPGKGGINWKEFVYTLKDIDFNACACVEIEDKDYESSFEDVLKAISESIENVKEYFNN